MAGCMPGAKITERVDDDALQRHDHGAARAGDDGVQGRDRGAWSSIPPHAACIWWAKARTRPAPRRRRWISIAAVQAAGEACELAGKSEVTMSGKAAALGGRLMGPVADQMLKQFVANFAARLARLQQPRMDGSRVGATAARRRRQRPTANASRNTPSPRATAARARSLPN